MSTPQVSIILIKCATKQNIDASLSDIPQFLGKFQIPHEIITGSHKEISNLLDRAQAEYLVISNAQLTTPLGDAFKLLQAVTSSPHIDVCFGNRLGKKDSPFLHNLSPRTELDLIYNPLFKSKLKDLFQDTLCDLIVVRKKYWNKLNDRQKTEINEIKWTPFLQRLCIETNARTADVPVYDNGQTDLAWPSWSSKLKMIWLSSKF